MRRRLVELLRKQKPEDNYDLVSVGERTNTQKILTIRLGQRDIKRIGKKVPKETKFRPQVIGLILDFKKHEAQDPSNNSYLSILLIRSLEDPNPVILEIFGMDNDMLQINASTNMPEATKTRLKEQGRFSIIN